MDETGPANSPVPEGADGSRGEEPPAPAGVGEPRDPAPPAVTLSGGSAAPPVPVDERVPLTQPSRREPSGAFLSHLQSLRELQITLSQEGRPEAILIEGTTGTVEIVGADCAVALVEPSNGMAPLRFGWIEGRHMAQHEIAVVSRRLDEAIEKVRSGQTTRVVLGGRRGGGGGRDGCRSGERLARSRADAQVRRHPRARNQRRDGLAWRSGPGAA